MDQMNQKIKEVFSDEAYVQEFLAFETPEEAQASLEEKGIEVSVEDLKQAADMINKFSEGELSEEELVEIAGGCDPGLVALTIVGTVLAVAGVSVPIIGDRLDAIRSGFSTAGRAIKNFFRRW